MENENLELDDWKMGEKNLKLLSLKEGFDKSYFSVVRANSKDKFDRIFSFDSNPFVSLNMYKNYVLEINNKAIEVYYSFTDRNALKAFLCDFGAYKQIGAFETSIFFFIDKEISVQYAQIRRLEALVKFWEENYKNINKKRK